MRDQLARKSTGGQVLGDRTPHGGAPDRLPLHRGDPVPAALQLGGDRASPLAPTGATIKVLRRPKPRQPCLSATLHGRTSRYIGVHFHPVSALLLASVTTGPTPNDLIDYLARGQKPQEKHNL
jgi:hypothetical protein